ncbi:MAG: 1-deoxy-D-xylulose-5-phosphate reductoisomerase, partial [Clostridiales bacterium]|nr:1-deoxy-D-xylulose-5-phosphate reductoisomerase [Clostridiales bacterium]
VAARAKGCDVLAAVVGVAGLPAAMAALGAADRLLLANKEALVTGGGLVMARAKAAGVPILPVDSEHSAIFQCLQAANGNSPRRLVLTASGGALRTWNRSEIENAQVGDVLRHPTWRMGRKITVDCATMMNKGLEVIEAHHLFGMPPERIDVIVHPESVVHSMVEFDDGAILAQMGEPDMRGPIGYALGYPDRVPYGGGRLPLAQGLKLTFEPPDLARFPCLGLAYRAQRQGGVAPVALNAANEAAVEAFLGGRIGFGAIARVVERVLEATPPAGVDSIEEVYAADRAARRRAAPAIEALAERKL